MVKDYEVEFPIYREHDVSGDLDSTIIYYRVDFVGGKMRETRVKVSKQQSFRRELVYEIHLDPNYYFDQRSEADYTLGHGAYASSAQAFNKAMAEAIAFAQGLQAPSLQA
jgi:hypothetical protein